MFFKTDTHVRNDFDGWDEDTTLFEAYASAKPNSSFIFEAGKKVMKWGKGYAWNPVSFIPPEESGGSGRGLGGNDCRHRGLHSQLDGPLKTLTLTTALIPVYKYVNAKFGEPRRTNFAAKLYLLLYDTDFDFLVLTGSSRTTRYGFDFSKNLTTSLEMHGEFAVVNNLDKMAINASGQGFTAQSDALSQLIGLRYLSERETTYILEYYHNGAGYSRSQIKNSSLSWTAVTKYIKKTGNDSGLARAAGLLDGPYGQPNFGQALSLFPRQSKGAFRYSLFHARHHIHHESYGRKPHRHPRTRLQPDDQS